MAGTSGRWKCHDSKSCGSKADDGGIVLLVQVQQSLNVGSCYRKIVVTEFEP
jgi:hypothetical protein